MSVLLIGGLSHSKIGLVDENDLPQYVGVKGHITFTEIPRLLVEKTEIGEFGKSQRFRPVYYLTRLAETAMWGLEGTYWYSWRILMFGIVIAAMLWLYTQFIGIFLGAVFTAYTLSFAMWVDIWTRSTGPSEQYTAFGSAIYAVGAWQFIKRWRAAQNLNASCLAMAAGAIIAMGSKENMLILELPLLSALAAGVWYRRLSATSAIALIAAIVFGAWIASSILAYFVNVKVEDIYGNSVQGKLFASKWMVAIYAGALITAISIFGTEVALRKVGNKEYLEQYRSLALRYGLYASIIVGVYVFNFFFYTGQIPSRARYDFPAVLVLPALLILLFESLSATAAFFGFSGRAKKLTGLVLAIALIAYTALTPWKLPEAVNASVARNSAFDSGLQEAQRMTRDHSEWPIFIKSFNYLDYEVIQALGVFFIARGINNPRYLVYVENPYGEPRSAFQSGLEKTLLAESADGGISRGYHPLADARHVSDENCFVIILRKPAQFTLDRVNGKDPAVGKKCALVPLFIYWEGNKLNFDPPK